MTFAPLSLSRRHVLGDLYSRCEAIEGEIPVFLGGDEIEVLGHADESLGHFTDAITFHVADNICKKLAVGQFVYSFEYEYIDPQPSVSRGRIKLSSITLNARKAYEKPVTSRGLRSKI